MLVLAPLVFKLAVVGVEVILGAELSVTVIVNVSTAVVPKELDAVTDALRVSPPKWEPDMFADKVI